MGFDTGSVLFIFQHNLVRPGQEDGGAEEGDVDEDLPLDVLVVLVADIDEGFQEMDAGNADQ